MPQRTPRTIRAPIFIHAPPAKVFRAITTPALLQGWFVDRATLAPRRGGTYQFTWEGGPTHTGKVVEYVRGKRIALAWQWPGHESLRPTTLRFDVQGRHGGTQLVLTHSGFLRGGPWGDLYEGAIRGWTYFTMNLKAVLETGRDLRSPCDW